MHSAEKAPLDFGKVVRMWDAARRGPTGGGRLVADKHMEGFSPPFPSHLSPTKQKRPRA